MSKRTVTVSLKTAILFVALCGVCMCAFGFSASVSHMTGGEKSAVYWAHMALCWAASVPCFVLLAIGWAVASRVPGDRLFTSRTADLLDRAARILLPDLVFFLVGNVVFAFLERDALITVYFAVIGIGGVVTVFLFVLAHYVREAAALREENEAFI